MSLLGRVRIVVPGSCREKGCREAGGPRVGEGCNALRGRRLYDRTIPAFATTSLSGGFAAQGCECSGPTARQCPFSEAEFAVVLHGPEGSETLLAQRILPGRTAPEEA